MATTQTTPKWHLRGDFYGNCSCEYLRCPCPTSNFTEVPTNGWCKLAIVFQIESGRFGDVDLEGCGVIMVADIPGAMADGGWSIGLIFDDKITPDQQQALGAILGGQAGGPMADFAPWVSNFLGAEMRPIEFTKNGADRSLSVPGMIELTAEGVIGTDGKQVVWDNVPHPANSRVGLGRGVKTAIHAFGVDFDGAPGRATGVMCPFDWRVG